MTKTHHSPLLLLVPLLFSAALGSCSKSGTDSPATASTATESLETPHSAVPDIGSAEETKKKKPPKLIPSISTIPRGRNVVLIVIDALNFQHLGVYGHKRPTSPNIDEIAKQGVVMTNHVSNSSWTRPSFTTIITGQPKSVHGVELSGRDLEKDIKTLAERFRDAGYRTAGFVGNPLVRRVWGYSQGYQTYVDTHDLKRGFPPDAHLADRALRWIDKGGDDPFFLMVFMTAPHTPYRPPTRHRNYLEKLPKGKVLEYPFREYLEPLPKDDHDRIVAAYDGEVAYSDEQFGRLVKHLEKKGLWDKTAVIVTADHGKAFGEHNCYTHTYHMWEPVVRVPMIVRSPDAISNHGSFDLPSTHIDIAPTALHLAGLDVPDDLPGLPLLHPAVRQKLDDQRIVFTQYNAHGIRRQGIRLGRWKLVHHHKVEQKALNRLNDLHKNLPHAKPESLLSIATKGERFELYNLQEDPDESQNLFGKVSNKKLDTLLEELKRHIGKDVQANPAVLSEETLKALEAAGYIQR